MALVSLYVPDSVPKNFLRRAPELVALAPSLVPPYALFDRTAKVDCACDTRNGLALRGRTVAVLARTHPATEYPLYALPYNCTFEETFIAVAWLLRHHFKTFENGVVGPTFKRSLGPASADWTHLIDTCPKGCETFTLERDPVFMLKPIVVSPYGKGPTLESACRLNKVSPDEPE